MIAVGVILVYRATRIINFAVGGMGVVGAVMLGLLTIQYHVPFWLAFLIAILLGFIFGAAVDSTILRRLRKAPKVVVLVATIGVASWRRSSRSRSLCRRTPPRGTRSAFNGSWTAGGGEHPRDRPVGARPGPDRVLALDLVPRSDDGRQDGEGVRSQPRARAGLEHQPQVGVDDGVGDGRGRCRRSRSSCSPASPDRSGMVANLGPETLSRALAAAVIAGMSSFRRGDRRRHRDRRRTEHPHASTSSADPGLSDLLLFIVVLVALGFYGREP